MSIQLSEPTEPTKSCRALAHFFLRMYGLFWPYIQSLISNLHSYSITLYYEFDLKQENKTTKLGT